MSTYRPEHQPWHDHLRYDCTCDPAWADRGLVDDRCLYHRQIEVVEDLRAEGWTVDMDRKGLQDELV